MITRYVLTGMRSPHCVRAVFTALGGVDGVARAEVRMHEAVVHHDDRATPERVAAALGDLGYGVRRWSRERALPLADPPLA